MNYKPFLLAGCKDKSDFLSTKFLLKNLQLFYFNLVTANPERTVLFSKAGAKIRANNLPPNIFKHLPANYLLKANKTGYYNAEKIHHRALLALSAHPRRYKRMEMGGIGRKILHLFLS